MYPLGFGGWSMKRKILFLLREANRSGDGYAYIDQLIELVGYSFRNRISELRLQERYDIRAEHDRVSGWRYHLEEPQQMGLEI